MQKSVQARKNRIIWNISRKTSTSKASICFRLMSTISSGRATSSMEFSHFEEVPANLAKEIIEKASGKRKDIE